MKAALLHSPGRLSVEECPDPVCPEGGVVIEVEACSLCASDVKMWKVGHRDLAYPCILGHEVVGKVVETKTDGVQVGSRVQVWPGVVCGHCSACQRSSDNHCDSIGVIGFNLNGGLADLMSVPRGCAERGGVNILPKWMGSDLASLTEPLACCVNAQESLGVVQEDSVVVIGGGPLGALHLLLAKQKMARRVMLIERDPWRTSLIEKHVKPDEVIGPSEDLKKAIMAATKGRGADAIILATSEPLPIPELVQALAKKGRMSLFSGLGAGSSTASIDLNQLHYHERSITGSYGCRSQDCREALRLLSNGEVVADWLITKRVPLSEIFEGLRHVVDREGMKATITNQEG
jgi:L-iditol 2-dehydrogenase